MTARPSLLLPFLSFLPFQPFQPFLLLLALLNLMPCGVLTAADPALPVRSGLVHTRSGLALTLVGPALAIGQPAPRAPLRDAALRSVDIAWNDGMVRIVTTAPSLDTPTCSRQALAFSQRAAALGPGIEVVFISRDLPFAQKRFCLAQHIAGLRVLSDYYAGDFARAWGIFLLESGLDARTATVVDGTGIVRYQQIVSMLSDEPDYDAVISAAQAARHP